MLVYGHKVKIVIDTIGFDSLIYFSHEQSLPILGRAGFFDHFKKVIFKEKDEILELEY